MLWIQRDVLFRKGLTYGLTHCSRFYLSPLAAQSCSLKFILLVISSSGIPANKEKKNLKRKYYRSCKNCVLSSMRYCTSRVLRSSAGSLGGSTGLYNRTASHNSIPIHSPPLPCVCQPFLWWLCFGLRTYSKSLQHYALFDTKHICCCLPKSVAIVCLGIAVSLGACIHLSTLAVF